MNPNPPLVTTLRYKFLRTKTFCELKSLKGDACYVGCMVGSSSEGDRLRILMPSLSQSSSRGWLRRQGSAYTADEFYVDY